MLQRWLKRDNAKSKNKGTRTRKILPLRLFGAKQLQWLPEVQHYQPDACMVIVGTKTDLRDNPNDEVVDPAGPISREEGKTFLMKKKRCRVKLLFVSFINTDSIVGMRFTKELGCTSYIECSALTQRGIRELFESSVALVLKKRVSDKKAVKAQRKKTWWQCNVLM
jgi:GTPase SAR1 family protein